MVPVRPRAVLNAFNIALLSAVTLLIDHGRSSHHAAFRRDFDVSTSVPNGQFYGRAGARRHLAGLVLAETSYSAGARVPEHAHDMPLMCLVLRGTIRECCERRARSIEAGSVFFHPDAAAHSHEFRHATRLFNIQLGNEWLDGLQPFLVARSGAPRTLGGRAPWMAAHVYHAFISGDTSRELDIEHMTLELLGSGVDETASTAVAPEWIRRMRDSLADRCLERVRMTDIASEFGVHPMHLSRAFHKHCGVTITSFIRERRLEYARRELCDSNRELSAIALEAGFSDQGHFSRIFKRQTGMTPGGYRALLGAGRAQARAFPRRIVPVA